MLHLFQEILHLKGEAILQPTDFTTKTTCLGPGKAHC